MSMQYQAKQFQSQYQNSSQCENYQDYCQNGYHPVYINQEFNNKYIVQQKLGWGHFSTVWLISSKNQKQQYYALKIQRSKKSHTQTAIDQLQLLKCIQNNKNHPIWLQTKQYIRQKYGKIMGITIQQNDTFCIQLLDNFVHYGIHGKHYCSVFNIMGPNLLDLIQHYQMNDQKMPLWLVKHITRQILLSLIYLHESCKMIHTDLKPENIMLEMDKDDMQMFIQGLKNYKKKPISMKYLQNLNGRCIKKKKKNEKKRKKRKAKKKQNTVNIEISQQQHQQVIMVQSSNSYQITQIKEQFSQNNSLPPTPTILPARKNSSFDPTTLIWKGNFIPINSKIKLRIVDFGNACWLNHQFTKNIQTREYRSPQAIIDIWSLGCIVYQMLTNSFLFKPRQKDGLSKDYLHLQLMIETLGKLPKNFALSGIQSRQYFTKKGQLINYRLVEQYSIKQMLVENNYEQKEASQIEQFLLNMLVYDPKKRSQACQLINHPWLWSENIQ